MDECGELITTRLKEILRRSRRPQSIAEITADRVSATRMGRDYFSISSKPRGL